MSRPSDPNAKAKLLSAAEEEFIAFGLTDARIERVAARAGLSKGAFYLHFESKEKAFEQVVESLVARLQHRMESVGCTPEAEAAMPWDDPVAYLDTWIARNIAIFEFVWQNRGLMSLLFRGGSCAQYRHLIEAFADRSAEHTRLTIATGQARGLYRTDLDADVAASFIAGAYDRFARHICQLSRKPDFPTVLRQLQSIVVSGIGSEALRGSKASPRVERPAAIRPRRKGRGHPQRPPLKDS